MLRLCERAVGPFLILCLLLASCSAPSPSATPTPDSPLPGFAGVATPAAPVIFAHDFAGKGAALGWNATNDLAQFTTGADGLATASTGGDPYMVGPALRLDAADALHIEIRMRHDRGSDAQLFWERAGQNFNEADSQHFTTIPDGAWHDYRITLKVHAGWQGRIVRLRLDPTTQQGANVTIAHIRGLGALPAALEVASFGAAVALPRAGEPFTVQAVAVNRGDQPADSAGLRLDAPDGVTVTGDATTTFAAVQPGAAITGTWSVRAGPGAYTLGLSVDGQPLAQALVIAEDPTGAELALSGDDVRLRFTDHSFGYGPATLEWRSGDDWLVAGRMRSFGTLVYLADDGTERHAAFFAPEMAADPASRWLEADAQHTDGELTWRLTAHFERSDAGPWLTAAYTLTANRPAQILAWTGPELYVAEGQADYRRDSALFPGLEFLTGDEMSSGTDYVDASAAARYVPHPNKITIPLMAVTGNGGAAGLMWDSLQAWDAAGYDRPAALFASPNRWEGQPNHLMRLFVPGVTAGLQENRDRLDTPYTLPAGQALHLSARLFAAAAADPLAPLDVWAAANPLPAVQPRPRPDAGSLRLALENYTTVTWVPEARGWRYAIHDPWGPGSNPAIALHLWLSTLAEPQSEAMAARRDMALSSAGSPPVGGQPNPWFYRPLWLLHTAGPAAEMQQAFQAALDIAARQQPDGSWPYTPNPAAQRTFGKAGDSSNGWVATSALPVLYMARLTGHPALVAAGRRALAYLEASPPRPEGAQTWELSLHVPDLLASAWTVQSFVEGYRLTGEPRYLDLAERWALAGLPFVYLWNAADRPIMRYTTIPVYGASNYIYPWFGRPVQWNGLDYAYGLHALAAELQAAGRPAQLNWRQVAEGITIATAQMQPESGLSPIFEKQFSDNSFGFRPKRSAHDALRRCQANITEGYKYVVDMDLEKYFDTVNQSRLIQILSETIKDGRVISLIHKFLRAGVMVGGMFEENPEGVPQGGPLSPLLGNIMLNECDHELEKRGHRFVRYADDLMIFCKSQKAANRTLNHILPYIEGKLFLRVNREKTQVAHVNKVKYLGYSFYISKGEGRLRIPPQSIRKLKDKIREITGRSNGMGIEARKLRLNQVIRGWMNYFKLADARNLIQELDKWIRSRIRMVTWKRWKRVRTRYVNLKRLGIKEEQAWMWANTRKGYWRTAHSPILLRALSNVRFKNAGYLSLMECYSAELNV